jgi:hypothetical protein
MYTNISTRKYTNFVYTIAYTRNLLYTHIHLTQQNNLNIHFGCRPSSTTGQHHVAPKNESYPEFNAQWICPLRDFCFVLGNLD